MKVYEAAIKRRSIRSFKQKRVDRKILKKCVNAARLSPSSANLQPLEYIIVDSSILLKKIFPCLKWAGYLDWSPSEKEMPRAYIFILANKEIISNYKHDSGVAAGVITLVAYEYDIGSCIIGSVGKEVRKILKIPEKYDIDLVIALGYAKHKSKIVNYKRSIKYSRDDKGNFYVPKRSLSSILRINKF